MQGVEQRCLLRDNASIFVRILQTKVMCHSGYRDTKIFGASISVSFLREESSAYKSQPVCFHGLHI